MVVFFTLQTLRPHGWPGNATLSGGVVQQPYGRYRLEPKSPTSVESMRMITLRIKLAANIVQGEIGRCLMLCFHVSTGASVTVQLHGMNCVFITDGASSHCINCTFVRVIQ